MAIKKAVYNVFNGEEWDKVHFETGTDQVITKDGLILDEIIRTSPILGTNMGKYTRFGDVGFPFVAADGVMEIGRFIDFHEDGVASDYSLRLESKKGVFNVWGDSSANSAWIRKYLRINDWNGAAEDGRIYFYSQGKQMRTENVEEFYVQGGAVARGKTENLSNNSTVYYLGGGIRLVRQVLTTGPSNSSGGVGFTVHFPKEWSWVQPISVISNNMNNTGSYTSGYCTVDTWSNSLLKGGCYNMSTGKPTQIILTYLASE